MAFLDCKNLGKKYMYRKKRLKLEKDIVFR